MISSWAPVQLVAGGCVAAANYKCEAAGAAFTARFEARVEDETSTNEEETETSPREEDYGKKDSKDWPSEHWMNMTRQSAQWIWSNIALVGHFEEKKAGSAGSGYLKISCLICIHCRSSFAPLLLRLVVLSCFFSL